MQQQESSSNSQENQNNSRFSKVYNTILSYIFSENWLFLFLLGIIAALFGLAIDISIQFLFLGQLKLDEAIDNYALGWLVWVLWSILFSIFAILPIILISPNASGKLDFCKV